MFKNDGFLCNESRVNRRSFTRSIQVNDPIHQTNANDFSHLGFMGQHRIFLNSIESLAVNQAKEIAAKRNALFGSLLEKFSSNVYLFLSIVTIHMSRQWQEKKKHNNNNNKQIAQKKMNELQQ